LLHPFSDVDSPDITGTFNGPFVNLPDPYTGAPADPTFYGLCSIEISPRNDRGYFPGSVELFVGTNQTPFLSWPVLATTSDKRRVIWIAQGRSGRIVYDGVVVSTPDTETRIDGVFRILLGNGRTLFNAFNTSVNIQ
jgi:hypothetical protein